MVNFDEIEFLDCEIVDDDPDAPMGTLVCVLEDGTVEEVVNDTDNNTQNVLPDVQDETAPLQDEESQDIVTTDDTTSDEIEIEEIVEETAVENSVEDDIFPALVEEVATANEEEPVVNEQENVASDVVEKVETAQVAPIETVDTTSENVDVAQEDNSVVEAVEQEVTLPAQEENPTDDTTNVTTQETVVEEPTKKAPNRRPPVKRTTAKVERTETPTQAHSFNLSGTQNVNDALFDTSFEIEQPQKAKVVSTKKKQEKTEDLWAVANVAPTKKQPKAKADEKAQSDDSAQEVSAPAPKKRATKKSTNVENTQNNTTEENTKVAKATEKSVKAEQKTANTEVKEEKVTKAKATKKAEPAVEPVAKEEKAPKTTAKAHDTDETVIVEGEGRMHGKYVIKKTDKGNFVFKLYSSNYRVVAIGAQAYTTLGAAKIGIQSVINNAENAPVENQTLKNYETLKFPKWEIYLDKKGEYRLRLFATNGNLIATTNDGYADISGAKNGIAAVARASKGCAIVRNDNLW